MDDYRNTYNNTSGPLGSVSPGGSVSGNIETDNDLDVFAVTLTAGKTYTFDMQGSASGNGTLTDLYFTLYDSNGSYLSSGSTVGSSTDDRLIYTARTTGTYYISAGGAYSTSTGTYKVSVSSGFVDDYRDVYSDTNEALGTIAPGGSITGNIETPNDLDVVAINLVAGTTYTFDMQGSASGNGTLTDLYFTLYDSNGSYLSSGSTVGSSTDDRLIYTARTTGTFYISAGGAYSTSTGTYKVSVSPGFVDDYRDTYSDTNEALGTLTPGGSITGNIETPNDVDVVAINLVAGTTYTFDMQGSASGNGTLTDLAFTLYDSTGSYLASGSTLGSSTDDRLIYTARTTGTFYVGASGAYSTSTGTYKVSASSGFIDDYRDVYSDTNEALGTLTPGGSITGNIETPNDVDVVAINLVAGTTYTFDMQGSASGHGTLTDLAFTLYDSTGSYLASGSTVGGSTDDRLTYTPTTTGTFYLSASGAYSTSLGTYTLTASGQFDDDYRDVYNSTTEPLGSLSPGGSSTGNIEIGGDADVFAITLVAGKTYFIDMKGQPSGGGTITDGSLTIYDKTGAYITSGASLNGTADDRATITASYTGTYYVSAAGALSTTTGTYTVAASSGYVDDYRDTWNSTIEPLGSITPAASKTGTIEIGGDADVFAINLVAGSSYTFTLTGSANGGGTLADSALTLLNQAGGLLAVGSSLNGTSDETITFVATYSGTHYLTAAGELSTETGTYTLSASAGTVSDDYRNTVSNTALPLGTVTINSSKSGVIETAGDHDIFKVTLSAGHSYTFDLGGNSAGGGALADPKLILRNSAGTALFTNNDYNGSNSRIVFNATASGSYYLDASGATTGTGGYLVSAAKDFDDSRDTISDTSAALGTLAANTSKLGAIETAGDHDIFKITLSAGHSYTFDLDSSSAGGVALANAKLILRNSAGTALFTDDDYNGSNARIVFHATTSGSYYLDASSSTSTGIGGYAISAEKDFDDSRDTISDTSAALATLSANTSKLGAIEIAGDHDIFKITLSTGHSYTFDLDSSSAGGAALANAKLILRNSAGAVLFTDDDYNGSNARIVFNATASGSYYLDASSSTSTGIGGYVVSAEKDFDDSRDTISDTSATLITLAANTSMLGAIETAGDHDIFKITLSAGHSYTFDLDSSSTGGVALANSKLILRNSSGTVLFTSDDYNGSNACIVYHATASGSYYLDASSSTSTGIGGYAISAMKDFDDSRDTYSDTSISLTTLVANTSRLGTIETTGDHDIFKISVIAGQNYTVDLVSSGAGGSALPNPELALLDSHGNSLFVNDDFNGANARIVFTATSSGTEYLDASSSTASGIGGYALSIRPGFDDFADSITDKASPLGTVSAAGTVMGTIESPGDIDVFKLKLSAGDLDEMTLTGGSGAGQLHDGELFLFNAGGTLLAYSDDANGSFDPEIDFAVPTTGTYYLAAEGVKSSTGSYLINVHDVTPLAAFHSASLLHSSNPTFVGS